MVKKNKTLSRDTIIFIGVWIVILLSIGIMYLTMYNPISNNNNNNNNLQENNLIGNSFKSIKTGDTNKGNVEIELTPNKINNKKLIVDFLLTTHSVETKDFDLKKITTLEIEGKTFKPISVPILSGHHNSGEIIFEVGDINSKNFKISIEGIPAVNLREFNWN